MSPPPKRQRLDPASNASFDGFLQSAVATEDPTISIRLSLERLVDSRLLQSDKEGLVDDAMRVASALMDAAIRSARKLAKVHNSAVWPLTADLTTKVFSMLDTESVCCAAMTCSLFNKCASDPLCYENIDLTRNAAKVDKQVVFMMIQRAGSKLKSIKLGTLPEDKKTSTKSPLTWDCLCALLLDGGAARLLRRLHLYNIEPEGYCLEAQRFRNEMQGHYFDWPGYYLEMQGHRLWSALSACQSLVELEIVGLDIPLDTILRTIYMCCHSIERVCLDNSAIMTPFAMHDVGRRRLNKQAHEHENLIKRCPLLTSLVLKGHRIEDDLLSFLIKGACGIKTLDLSGSYGFSGNFLRDRGGGADSLETLILRNCSHLGAEEVSLFLSAILFGDWKALRHVDISNSRGLLRSCICFKCVSPIHCAIDVSQVLQERHDIHLIADFPSKMCIYGGSTSLASCEATSISFIF